MRGLREIPCHAKIASKRNDEDSPPNLRDPVIRCVHELEAHVISVRDVRRSGALRFDQALVVILPSFALYALFEGRFDLTKDVLPVWIERCAQQSLHVLGDDHAWVGLAHTPQQLRPHVPLVQVPAVRTSEAEGLTWNTPGDDIDTVDQTTEVDSPDVALDQRPRVVQRARQRIAVRIVAREVRPKRRAGLGVELVDEEVSEAGLVHRHGEPATAREQLDARTDLGPRLAYVAHRVQWIHARHATREGRQLGGAAMGLGCSGWSAFCGTVRL